MSVKLISAWVFCALALLVSSAISAPITTDKSFIEKTASADTEEEGDDAGEEEGED